MSMKLSAGNSEKEAALRDWVRRKLGAVEHELRVADAARMLFALTRRWHQLGTAEGNLLVMAAIVHDVGRAFGEDNHARIGSEMILENERLSPNDRRRLAFLTRYHRGRVPERGAEEILEKGDDLGAMRVL